MTTAADIERKAQEKVIEQLKSEYDFSDGSIDLLLDKGFSEAKKDFSRLREVLQQPPKTFAQHRTQGSWLERLLDEGDTIEITTGRYARSVRPFSDISSEQALFQGRLKFAVEYVIGLADLLTETAPDNALVERSFTDTEKATLRSFYDHFTTTDYAAIKLIEEKTNHDIVATNTWLTIQAQRAGLDDRLMRRLVHFARTSADVNTNVTGELYMKALGQWTNSVAKLLSTLQNKARAYAKVTCIAETHGQPAQLTTLGHTYATLAEQIRLHLEPLLQPRKFQLDGKIAGAIGTDVDFKAAFPKVDPTPLYRHLVEENFGLRFVHRGNDQDCSNARFAQMLDVMVNIGMVVEKAATDHWLYASSGMLAKATSKGESGSSAMPQKANPFLAEGCEALMSVVAASIEPLKKMVVAYREQGDLRRSITLREGFHPIMLSIIGINRLRTELEQYQPHPVEIEAAVYKHGPKVASSAVQNYLRARGIAAAYDGIKNIVMAPVVDPQDVLQYVSSLVGTAHFTSQDAQVVQGMLGSVMDTKGYLQRFMEAQTPPQVERSVRNLRAANRNVKARERLLGTAVPDTYAMAQRVDTTIKRLERYMV